MSIYKRETFCWKFATLILVRKRLKIPRHASIGVWQFNAKFRTLSLCIAMFIEMFAYLELGSSLNEHHLTDSIIMNVRQTDTLSNLNRTLETSNQILCILLVLAIRRNDKLGINDH